MITADAFSQPVAPGVPLGSGLGPLLFLFYALPLGCVIGQNGISFYCHCMLLMTHNSIEL